MTVLTGDFSDLTLANDSATVEFFCDPVRFSSDGTSIITPKQVLVNVVNGSLTTPALDPGPAKVRIVSGNWRQTYNIVIPSSGSHDLIDLLEKYEIHTSSVVSSAWAAQQAAQAARDEAANSEAAAAQSAQDAADSAAVAIGVAGIGPATPSVLGLIKLAGDLSGDANTPVVVGLSGKAPLASPTFTGTVEIPALKITGGTPGLNKVLTSDADGDATWQTVPSAANATSATPGLVQLQGDLGGTATSPTVPALVNKAPLIGPTFTGTVTLDSLKVQNGTPAIGNILTSDALGFGTWQPLPTNTYGAAMAMVLG